MDAALKALLEELAEFGRANDASTSERAQRMLNITPDTGEFLSLLIRIMRAQRILEIGTSNGYSTLWMADAAKAVNGRVATIEMAEFKLTMARQNFARAGLGDYIDLLAGDAGKILNNTPDAAYELIFLDSKRSEYLAWWPELRRVLKPGGLLVVDNAVSHADEMQAFMQTVRQDEDFVTNLVPIGNGEFLATRRDEAANE